MNIIHRLDRVIAKVKEQPKDLLILRLTVIALLLYSPPYNPLKSMVLPILCAIMLVSSDFLTRRFLWAVLVFSFVATNVAFWYEFDNHHYLTNYWCIVCLLAVRTKNARDILSWNGRLLIGLCFFFATLWKIIALQFFDGSFLQATILLDRRLEMAAYLFGGLPAEVLYNNRELLDYFAATSLGQEALLTTSPQLAFLSVILSYWTILCEGMVAIAFLIPQLKWLYDRRDYLLMLFIITTYPLVPVGGFASLLAVMGLAQCSCDRPRVQFAYLILLVFIPFWMDIPQIIFDRFLI